MIIFTPMLFCLIALLWLFILERRRKAVVFKEAQEKASLDEAQMQMSKKDYDALVAGGWKPSEAVRAHFNKPQPKQFFRDGWYTEAEYRNELAWEQKRGIAQQKELLAKRQLSEAETFSAEERKARIAVENVIRAKYVSVGESKSTVVITPEMVVWR